MICREQEQALAKAENYLQNMFYQSSMLLTLINDLLDLAKIETLNFRFNDDYFNLNQVITNAYNTIKYQADQKKIKIKTDYQMRITNTKSRYFDVKLSTDELKRFFRNVLGDKLRYMQILMNFLSNAIKFTNEGRSITIRLVLLEV